MFTILQERWSIQKILPGIYTAQIRFKKQFSTYFSFLCGFGYTHQIY